MVQNEVPAQLVSECFLVTVARSKTTLMRPFKLYVKHFVSLLNSCQAVHTQMLEQQATGRMGEVAR